MNCSRLSGDFYDDFGFIIVRLVYRCCFMSVLHAVKWSLLLYIPAANVCLSRKKFGMIIISLFMCWIRCESCYGTQLTTQIIKAAGYVSAK